MSTIETYVTKRSGQHQPIEFDKVMHRIRRLCAQGPHGPAITNVDCFHIAQDVIGDIYNGIKTSELDEIAARLCANMANIHPDYGTLASRIIISSHHKNTAQYKQFTDVIEALWTNVDKASRPNPLIAPDKYKWIMANADALNALVDYDLDYKFTYFAFKTHEKGYLLKLSSTGQIIERQQDLLMRVAIQASWNGSKKKGQVSGQPLDDTSMDDVRTAYRLVSQHYVTFATPTLFNACTPHNQNSSCFLFPMISDSIEGIYDTKKKCALISKWSGGIGISITNIRSAGSLIRGTNGVSGGLIGLLRSLESDALYVNQGGRRNGSIAVYLEPWHADIYDFIKAGNFNTEEGARAFNLFYAIWMNDAFMRRLEKAREHFKISLKKSKTAADIERLKALEPYTEWYLFCPDTCPELIDLYGDAFDEAYEQNIAAGLWKKKTKVLSLWNAICKAQIETGTPYISYKDAVNKKSNHQHIGTIRNSNLCVSGQTRILTREGWYRMDHLRNRRVDAWNGQEWSSVKIVQTTGPTQLMRVSFSNGASIDCTPEHDFYLYDEDRGGTHTRTACELKPGDKIDYWKAPDECQEGNNIEAHLYQAKMPWSNPYHRRRAWFDTNRHLYIGPKVTANTAKYFTMFCQTIGVHVTFRDITRPFQAKIQNQNQDKSTNTTQKVKGPYKYVGAIVDHPMDHHIEVVGTEVLNGTRPTYCAEEPLRHQLIFEGIISGNCNEIVELSDPTHFAVCNLSSVALPMFVDAKGVFDYKALYDVVFKTATLMDNIITDNYYPVPECERSNSRDRPIGIGVQGYHDALIKMRLRFDSEDALDVNRKIFETMQFAYLSASNALAKRIGAHDTFKGSPLSLGLFQADLWAHHDGIEIKYSGMWDWEALREDIKKHGVRNSLGIALMPTASTSQILDNSIAFEPYNGNYFVRRTLAGEFTVFNKYLQRDLIELGLWSKVRDRIMAAPYGTIQKIQEIPKHIRDLYKTVWDISAKWTIDHCAERGPWVCQTQSMNLFFLVPTIASLTQAHLYGWRRNLKTGSYYVRQAGQAKAIQFTVDPKLVKKIAPKEEESPYCKKIDGCVVCSS